MTNVIGIDAVGGSRTHLANVSDVRWPFGARSLCGRSLGTLDALYGVEQTPTLAEPSRSKPGYIGGTCSRCARAYREALVTS